MTCVPPPESFSEMLFTVTPNAGAATTRSRSAASAPHAPFRRPAPIPLVSSRILVTLFRLQFDRQRLGLAEGVLYDLKLRLGDPRDVAVHHRIPHPQHESPAAAVFHQSKLVRSAPHDSHQVDVADVHERAVAGTLELPIEKRLERIAPPAARVRVLVAREEHARVERLRRLR